MDITYKGFINDRAKTGRILEQKWYRKIELFLPPPEFCTRHPGLDDVFRQIKTDAEPSKSVHPKVDTNNLDSHGVMNMAMYVDLQPEPGAAVACNCPLQ